LLGYGSESESSPKWLKEPYSALTTLLQSTSMTKHMSLQLIGIKMYSRLDDRHPSSMYRYTSSITYTITPPEVYPLGASLSEVQTLLCKMSQVWPPFIVPRFSDVRSLTEKRTHLYFFQPTGTFWFETFSLSPLKRWHVYICDEWDPMICNV
jgi:hypothetical protein